MSLKDSYIIMLMKKIIAFLGWVCNYEIWTGVIHISFFIRNKLGWSYFFLKKNWVRGWLYSFFLEASHDELDSNIIWFLGVKIKEIWIGGDSYFIHWIGLGVSLFIYSYRITHHLTLIDKLGGELILMDWISYGGDLFNYQL